MKKIEVVAALIFDSHGRILIAQRKSPESMRGLWEFPGGKVEIGESFPEALKREIREELALDIEIKKFVGLFEHRYSDLHVAISAFEASVSKTDFQILSHLDVRWVEPQSLSQFPLVEADKLIFPSYLAQNS